MAMKTPDWILKGEKKPSEKKKGKTFRVKKCPECGSTGVEVILGKEEGKGTGEWECKKCKWHGRDVAVDEVDEKEFMKHQGEGE